MRRLLRETLAAAAIYGGALVAGGLVFLALARSGLFAPIGILFYRGLAELGATALLLLAGLLAARSASRLRRWLRPRDALGASLTATALLLAAFTVGPVTVDRSISIFMLGRFAATPAPLGRAEVEAAFLATYVRDWAQIARRLDEQVASGNLEPAPGGYRLTPQGARVLSVARTTAEIFDTDRRFVGLRNASVADTE